MELKINKELKEIIPPLTEEKYEKLKQSIKEKGQLKPIDIMNDGTIVDGYHRYRACKELKIEPLYSVMPNIKTIQDAKEYSFEINFVRRQLTAYEAAKWAIEVYKSTSEISDVGYRELAKKIGIHKDVICQVAQILKQAPQNILEDLAENRTAVYEAYHKVKEAENIDTQIDILEDKQFQKEMKEKYEDKKYEIGNFNKLQEDIQKHKGEWIEVTEEDKDIAKIIELGNKWEKKGSKKIKVLHSEVEYNITIKLR